MKQRLNIRVEQPSIGKFQWPTLHTLSDSTAIAVGTGRGHRLFSKVDTSRAQETSNEPLISSCQPKYENQFFFHILYKIIEFCLVL